MWWNSLGCKTAVKNTIAARLVNMRVGTGTGDSITAMRSEEETKHLEGDYKR